MESERPRERNSLYSNRFLARGPIQRELLLRSLCTTSRGRKPSRCTAPALSHGTQLLTPKTRACPSQTLKSWVEELRDQGPENIVIAVAGVWQTLPRPVGNNGNHGVGRLALCALTGNKSDLESERQVDTATAQSYAHSIGAAFLETSAKVPRVCS